MYNISESIETIGSIIDGLLIDEKKIAGFREQYRKILLRSKDSNFYLSTIGDFSSGKSTLINKIINRKLLKVAHAATTAVPTYIYRGNSPCVVINVKCDNGERYNLANETDVRKLEEEFDIRLPQEIDERISLLTADRELSLKIEEVNIELPDDELAKDLYIIDTPGINPGADFAEKHAEITKYILNEKADAIIILFPADQAYTQSFEKFLKDNAEYFMKDAIFVVTMMDRVDEEERDDVIQFVKANLRTNFDLKDPQVLSCSALLAGKDPYWAEKFEEFEKSLMDRLALNRQRIVTEKLVNLSDELLSSIQSEILCQRNGFEDRLTVLQNHSVPNLISFLNDSEDAANKELSGIQARHKEAIKEERSELRNRIMQKVNAGLNACDCRSDVTRYAQQSLASDMEGACKDIYATSAQYMQSLNSALSSAVAEMIEKLKKYYGEIGSVLSVNASLSATEHQVAIADKLTGLGKMISDYEGKIDTFAIVGGAGLAAIILTGLGPVGWIIGGFAALIGGDRLFVDSSRSKVRDSVSGKIPEISDSIEKSLNNEMKLNFDAAKKTLKTKKDELVAQYEPVYEKLERQFTLEKTSLILKIKHSEEMQKMIKSVLQQINKIKGEIAE